ncbi:hypothetical protein [Thalassomonas actiniarum]|uniref:Uncharacterized protein n=1 Tax=Thalassomonas actiniarum TaxID=485447 RepID=A0AAE9YY94_9GAMM|nr:hypothetical protein [Thalassomonas actiniarum]WDE02569.1 hypothetical protein SG35_029635 [Thalassomonas actiniarum]
MSNTLQKTNNKRGEDEPDYLTYLINIFMMPVVFYLLSGKTYRKLVQYQHDHFTYIKEAREEIEKILSARSQQQK